MPDHASRILLVEGQNDRHVVRHIIRRLGLDFDIDIRDGDDRGGYPNLRDRIDTTIDESDVEAVGIMADANDEIANRWASITDAARASERLRLASIELPGTPEPEGTVIEGRPRVGIWLMPNNRTPGELEDFVEAMIPNGDPVWPRARAYIDGIPQADRKFAQGKIQRAKVHAWLAAREEPRRMGLAVGAGDLDVNVRHCRDFADWLRRLFAP